MSALIGYVLGILVGYSIFYHKDAATPAPDPLAQLERILEVDRLEYIAKCIDAYQHEVGTWFTLNDAHGLRWLARRLRSTSRPGGTP